MNLEIRLLAHDDDHTAAGALVQQAYFALPGYPRDDEYDVLLGDVGGRFNEAPVLVAIADGKLVGCLTYVPDQHSAHAEFDDGAAASFRYFAIAPSMQGKGIGEAMVQWCIDEATRAGRQRLRIHTLETMPAAQRLYLRLGFIRDPDGDEDWDGITGLAFVYHC